MIMKRFASLLIALLLAMSFAVSAAAEAPVFTTKYFTLTLPEGWIIDMDTSDAEQQEGMEDLGYFYAPDSVGMTVEAYLIYYEELKEFALWNVEDADIQAYADLILEEYADEKPVFLGILKAGAVPFVLVKVTDEEGEYIYADTVTNGYSIQFAAYISDYDAEKSYDLKDEDIELFKTILSTFKPV